MRCGNFIIFFGGALSTYFHFVLLIWQHVALYEHNKKFHLIFIYFCRHKVPYFCYKIITYFYLHFPTRADCVFVKSHAILNKFSRKSLKYLHICKILCNFAGFLWNHLFCINYYHEDRYNQTLFFGSPIQERDMYFWAMFAHVCRCYASLCASVFYCTR